MIYNPKLDLISNLYFKNLIAEHHELYLKLSTSNLKPKYHNMIHYPFIIENVGPLNEISSIRFEAKHRPLKVSARTSNNRKNLIHTISIKCQSKLSFTLLNYNENLIKSDLIKHGKKMNTKNNNIFNSFNFNPKKNRIFLTNFVKYRHVTLKKGYVIQTGVYEDDVPMFSIIKNFLISSGYYFVCVNELINYGFNWHYFEFEVEETEIGHTIKLSKDMILELKLFSLNVLPMIKAVNVI